MRARVGAGHACTCACDRLVYRNCVYVCACAAALRAVPWAWDPPTPPTPPPAGSLRVGTALCFLQKEAPAAGSVSTVSAGASSSKHQPTAASAAAAAGAGAGRKVRKAEVAGGDDEGGCGGSDGDSDAGSGPGTAGPGADAGAGAGQGFVADDGFAGSVFDSEYDPSAPPVTFDGGEYGYNDAPSRVVLIGRVAGAWPSRPPPPSEGSLPRRFLSALWSSPACLARYPALWSLPRALALVPCCGCLGQCWPRTLKQRAAFV
jgi:hypothetical protein